MRQKLQLHFNIPFYQAEIPPLVGNLNAIFPDLTISMVGVAPIAMSQTKEDLLKHLNLPAETYALMAVCFPSRSLSKPLYTTQSVTMSLNIW